MPHSTLVQNTTLDGQNIDVASLETINFARLVKRAADEIEKLHRAAELPGFFYLDLRDEPAGFLPALRAVYTVSETHFEPNEKQVMIELRRDEFAIGSHEDLLPKTGLQDHGDLLKQFSSQCHHVNMHVLSCLSDALQLKGSSRFESSHRDDVPSDTALNLIYSPAKAKLVDAPDTTHTDTGTLTSLFCDRWGIQIEHPETKVWQFVEPKPGCALVNVADSLQSLSGNKLHSCRHRHTQPVDGFQPRYFVVSYLRPNKGGLA